MNRKAISTVMLIAVSSALLVTACHGSEAVISLDLPVDPVMIEVFAGNESYLTTVLSHVPDGYSVANGTYPGWRVDMRYPIIGSPATHWVWLYSSMNPPSDLHGQKWDMVNYILNHKQGSVKEIQQAILYFINCQGGFTPWSSRAWAMVNDAEANGTGFTPTSGQAIAVICSKPLSNIPITIIEVYALNTLLTDLNGDRIVNIVDVTLVLKAFGSTPGIPNWNPVGDINHDGIVNVIDVTLITKDYGKTSL